MKNILLLLVLVSVLLTSCGMGGEIETGPQVTFLKFYSIALTVNPLNGEFHLSGNVTLPTPLRSKFVEIDWIGAFDIVFNEAQETENTLFVMYDDDAEGIIEDVYRLDLPFELSFSRNEWVRKIKNTGSGSTVVFVERFSSRSQPNFIRLEDFEIAGCSTKLKCPDTASLQSLFDDSVSLADGNYHETSISPYTIPRFNLGWCTNDEVLLRQNLEHITFVFMINGVSYSDYLESRFYSTPNPDNEDETMYCYVEGAVVKNWKYGTYDVQFGFWNDTEIYDGWDTYPPKDFIRYLFFIVE